MYNLYMGDYVCTHFQSTSINNIPLTKYSNLTVKFFLLAFGITHSSASYYVLCNAGHYQQGGLPCTGRA